MKRTLAMLLAVIMIVGLTPLTVLASVTVAMPYDSAVTTGFDEDGDPLTSVHVDGINGEVTADYVNPGTKFYVELPDDSTPILLSGGIVSMSEVYKSDNFTFRLDRDQNGKYLDQVKFVGKRLGSTGTRKNYIEVTLKNATIVEDAKVTFDVSFRARRSESGKWDGGDEINTRFELWVNNEHASGDTVIGTGDGVVFEPISNETNTITWGVDYPVASLEFEASSDADKFYAKLSTKIIRDIYESYGDPVDADLFFRTFTGKPKIDATSRATLTLYDPWEDDDNDYAYNRGVNYRDCYIYLADNDGYLEDVTHLFTYTDGDNTPEGVPGWQSRTRTLGSYIISDMELDIEYDGNPDIDWIETPDAPAPIVPIVPGTETPLPPTGSSDLLAGAAILLVISGGLVLGFKKRK